MDQACRGDGQMETDRQGPQPKGAQWRALLALLQRGASFRHIQQLELPG